MIILMFFSFLAGVVTVLSPCILPVLPLLLGAQVGQGNYRAYGIIMGLIASFTFFTLALTALVHATGISPDFLRYIAIGITIFFGLTLLFPQLSSYFERATSGLARLGTVLQQTSDNKSTGFWSGFILGGALGLIWTPCAGPILATITALVATSALNIQAVLVTLVYSIGAAVPMFLIMYGGNSIIASTQFLSGYTELIRKIFGVLMILGALAIAFHFDVVLQQIAVRYFPVITFEDNETVKKELEKLRMNTNKMNNTMLANEGQAPALVGLTDWINSKPLSLDELKGKVVLIDFWTYSCINCVRTLPHVKEWYNKYKNDGFIIIGVHTPEFEFEKNPANVKDAVKRFDITYPVALDNNYQTWQNYNNRYWPAHYLIDEAGIIRYVHFGEGNYKETENAIRTLLGLSHMAEKQERADRRSETPETYLGYQRASNYHPDIIIQENKTASYSYNGMLGDDQIGLKGSWFISAQYIKAMGDSTLSLNFIADKVYLVMDSDQKAAIQVLLDSNPLPKHYYTKDYNERGELVVQGARMYEVLDLKGDYGRHIVTLQIPSEVKAYVFTFGQ